MRHADGRLLFSATDLSRHLSCAHLTSLRRGVALGEIEQPPPYDDPRAEVLKQRGIEHERRLLERFAAEGRTVEAHHPGRHGRSRQRDPEAATARTREAMRRGVDVVYQGRLQNEDGRWSGYPDFLVRVDEASALGGWSYEVLDAKLARHRERRGAASTPAVFGPAGAGAGQQAGVDAPGARRQRRASRRRASGSWSTPRTNRAVRRRFEAHAAEPPDTYPEPVDHCALCDWKQDCADRRRADDHLSLVAGITRSQRRRLADRGVTTMADLGALDLTAFPPLDGVGHDALVRIREQARIQDRGRREGRRIRELITPVEEDKGLAALPAPSPGDLFFDLEGDAFAMNGGLEYLFGAADRHGGYEGCWALDPPAEKRAFERFIDRVTARWREHPGFHIYHYGAYETTAVKRLMSRYATREEEVDRLLRGRVFVDLHRVVRQGLRASVEGYSIKRLEPFYGFRRRIDLTAATRALVRFEAALESGEAHGTADALRTEIEGYNRDDCLSTLRLAEWLEGCRRELETRTGQPVPRPALRDEERDQERESAAEIAALFVALTAGLPEEDDGLDDEQRARRLLAHLLEFHRREEKSMWWEFFDRCGFSAEEHVASRATLGALRYVGEAGQVKKSIIHRYRFPEQTHEMEVGKRPQNPATVESNEQGKGSCGTVVAIDEAARTIDLRRGRTSPVPHPAALIPLDAVNSKVLQGSLLRLAEEVASNGFVVDGPRRAAFDLLRGVPPRIETAVPRPGVLSLFPQEDGVAPEDLVAPGETPLDAVRRIAPRLDRSVLPVQGPPGSGKTYTGARMILDLLAEGKRVGVTANSHKVISNLLGAVLEAADERPTERTRTRHGHADPAASLDEHERLHPEGGPDVPRPGNRPVRVRGIQKANDGDGCADERIVQTDSNEAVAGALANGDANLAGGTAWLWARPEMADAVDVLVIDEGGQMSLANALAVCQAAGSLVLLGDPRQLDQPIQGVHPPGADVSALGHLLGESATVDPSRGVFLEHTWRMHPDVCAFTTEQFYEGRLGTRPELARQTVIAPGALAGHGLRFVPVEHAGNTNASAEEADRVAALVGELLDAGATWVDQEGDRRPLALQDVLVVAPYNAHVAALRASAAGRRAGRHRGQVPGAGGADCPLLDGHIDRRRGAARNGVPLQPAPPQRRHLPRPLRGGHRRQPRPPHAGLPHPGADAPGQPLLPVSGVGVDHDANRLNSACDSGPTPSHPW